MARIVFVFNIIHRRPNDPDSALIHVLDVRKALRVLGFNLAMDQVRAHVNDSALDTLPADHADFNTFLDIVIDLQSNSPDYYDDLVRGTLKDFFIMISFNVRH